MKPSVLMLSVAFLVLGEIQAKALPASDFDNDCDVDLDDFGFFQACATGPDAGPPIPGCEAADLDFDFDVDQSDFGVFQRCYSGAGNPADPNCDVPCAQGPCDCPCDQTDCDGTCVDTATDEANCGACGNTCAAGLTCQNGTCSGTCPGPCFGGQLCCDGACREVGLNPSHCGGCFIQCGPGQNCAGGVCQDAEPPGG